jgi:O-methyltransferase involved in polyketide biosynthesis
MEEGKPSFTAEIDAVIRGVETQKPEGERLCYDPFARGFVGATKRITGILGRYITDQRFILSLYPGFSASTD